ncbi:MAG: hypothetical protein JW751_27090 [Polyangiaceae bacterium]|nr:hypothetical protein [Polyangiaceae bacterium]
MAKGGDDPRCEATPGAGENVQYALGAAPGVRQLTIIRERSFRGGLHYLGSYCDDPEDYAADVVRAIVADFAHWGGCPVFAPIPTDGCFLVEASFAPAHCTCEERGLRRHREPKLVEALANELSPGSCTAMADPSCAEACICELPELSGEARDLCRSSDAPYLLDPTTGGPLRGWCDIDRDAPLAAPWLDARSCPVEDGHLRVLTDPTAPSRMLHATACER